jgi:hypothetical protein
VAIQLKKNAIAFYKERHQKTVNGNYTLEACLVVEVICLLRAAFH